MRDVRIFGDGTVGGSQALRRSAGLEAEPTRAAGNRCSGGGSPGHQLPLSTHASWRAYRGHAKELRFPSSAKELRLPSTAKELRFPSTAKELRLLSTAVFLVARFMAGVLAPWPGGLRTDHI